jgi:hypothetical protein
MKLTPAESLMTKLKFGMTLSKSFPIKELTFLFERVLLFFAIVEHET